MLPTVREFAPTTQYSRTTIETMIWREHLRIEHDVRRGHIVTVIPEDTQKIILNRIKGQARKEKCHQKVSYTPEAEKRLMDKFCRDLSHVRRIVQKNPEKKLDIMEYLDRWGKEFGGIAG